MLGSHCSYPTKLTGFDMPSEPFDITHHHGNRDAVPRTIWKVGQQITCIDFLPSEGDRGVYEEESVSERSQMLISTGSVVENKSVPPSGGCVVSVKVKFDGGHEVLTFQPNIHISL